jgi:NCAIR mutase (PurE)-related protein
VDREKVREILRRVQEGATSIDEAAERLAVLPYMDLGMAQLDLHRGLRRGFPEVVLCEGKEPADVGVIVERLAAEGGQVLATRASKEAFARVRERVPEAAYHERSGAITVREGPAEAGEGMVAVLSAGTSDIPVAEEAVVTARMMGSRVSERYDVGVAGIHRLLGCADLMREANVVAVAAGMEGALASVVSGFVEVPVVAIPTSVGYGASFGGLSALLGMLNSCSAGVVVVNIDNGFGGGYAAGLINRLACRSRGAESEGRSAQ